MRLLILLTLLQIVLSSFNNTSVSPVSNTIYIVPENPFKQIRAIPLPSEFERIKADLGSFATYLRTIGLKAQTTVYLYNGQPKHNQNAQYALLNISVGNTDLQQCADAVMRLRSEYLFAQKQFDQIIFRDNDNTTTHLLLPISGSILINTSTGFSVCAVQHLYQSN